jgi:hypothetical protein
LSSELKIYRDQAAVYPEIAAQINGYVRSDRWDRRAPKFMLVDVGGGTVDAAVFNVVPQSNGGNRFAFFRSQVERLGVGVLHRRRLEWLFSQAKGGSPDVLIDELARLKAQPSRTRALQSVTDYLLGARISGHTIDDEFYSEYAHLLWNDLLNVVRTKIDPQREQWLDLPILFCGGGREIRLYRKFAEVITANKLFSVGLREFELEAPAKMSAPGLAEGEFQRLSVAYGLSFLDLDEYVTADAIEDMPLEAIEHPRAEYVGKDMV